MCAGSQRREDTCAHNNCPQPTHSALPYVTFQLFFVNDEELCLHSEQSSCGSNRLGLPWTVCRNAACPPYGEERHGRHSSWDSVLANREDGSILLMEMFEVALGFCLRSVKVSSETLKGILPFQGSHPFLVQPESDKREEGGSCFG